MFQNTAARPGGVFFTCSVKRRSHWSRWWTPASVAAAASDAESTPESPGGKRTERLERALDASCVCPTSVRISAISEASAHPHPNQKQKFKTSFPITETSNRWEHWFLRIGSC